MPWNLSVREHGEKRKEPGVKNFANLTIPISLAIFFLSILSMLKLCRAHFSAKVKNDEG